MQQTELDIWLATSKLLGNTNQKLGPLLSRVFRNNLQEITTHLSCVKLAAKLAGPYRHILEIGSGLGLGAPILSECAASYQGWERDPTLLREAKETFDYPFTGDLEALKDSDTLICLEPQLYETSWLINFILDKLPSRGICLLAQPAKPVTKGLSPHFLRSLSIGLNQATGSVCPKEASSYFIWIGVR